NLRDGSDGNDIVEGQAVAGVRLDAVLDGQRGAVADPPQFRRSLVAFRVGVAPGMKLDDRSAEADGGRDLLLGRLDEQADADACSSELVDKISEVIVLPGGVESALSGALLAPFGD